MYMYICKYLHHYIHSHTHIHTRAKGEQVNIRTLNMTHINRQGDTRMRMIKYSCRDWPPGRAQQRLDQISCIAELVQRESNVLDRLENTPSA